MATLTRELKDFIYRMPKAEIHIHLEGSIKPETVMDLAWRNKKTDMLPAPDVAGLRAWYSFKDFNHFIDVYIVVQAMLRKPEDFELVTYQNAADMAEQNIRYREITFTPWLHLGWDPKGIPVDEIIGGLDKGRQRAKHDFGVEIRWVFDIPRNGADDDEKRALMSQTTLDAAVAARDFGLVGFGLGGYEVGYPPELFETWFTKAKELGMLSVPHAGETEGPASVWGSVNQLQADRLGHGVRAFEDPKLLELLKERQIPLEINPTSNICLHVYESYAEHPFRKLDEMGLLVTVNSDDPPLFNTSLIQEYEVLAEHFDYGKEDLVRIARNAYLVCGADEETKNELLGEFDAWVAEN